MPRLIWVFAERTSFCWFCHAQFNKLPLAVRHLDGQRRIYMCTDPDSFRKTVCDLFQPRNRLNYPNIMHLSFVTMAPMGPAPVICNHAPYGAREQRCYWLFSLQSPGICLALQEPLAKRNAYCSIYPRFFHHCFISFHSKTIYSPFPLIHLSDNAFLSDHFLKQNAIKMVYQYLRL